MSTKVLIPATTDAVISESITPGYDNQVGIHTSGLSGTEEIKIRIYAPAKADQSDPWDDVDTITASNPTKVIYLDAFTYRLEKPVTGAPVGVSIANNKQ